MKTWIHAKRAVIGDGETVLSPAWVAFEGKYITDVTECRPEHTEAGQFVELGDVTISAENPSDILRRGKPSESVPPT